jgi:hypothetical protein
MKRSTALVPHEHMRRSWTIAVMVIVCLLLLSARQVISAQGNDGTGSDLQTLLQTRMLYLPLVMTNYAPPESRLCRFGVGAPSDVARYPVNQLRIGWYTDWGARLHPARPGGIAYLQMVRLTQPQYGVDSYTSVPSASELPSMIAANPGALWVIGNEPDRRFVQDDIEPAVYAHAYHDLYDQITAADPLARIVAGSIVQPTPLRLQYLDLILDSYQTRYDEPMPVDVWNIHAFILNEADCTAFPDACWGAGIPPGINATEGIRFGIQDNDNLDVFKQFVVNFRQWMIARGYQESALIITEYGVLMPQDYGFPPSRVNAYMNATFDYLTTATGPTGNPADKGRLVQAWAWYSLADRTFNGWLFDPATVQRTVYGDNFVAYTVGIRPEVNLAPIKLRAEAVPTASHTVKLVVQVSNNGNIAMRGPTSVQFYSGDPAQGGLPIGSPQVLPLLDGCGSTTEVAVTWDSAPSGASVVWAAVDLQNAITESNESDNQLSAVVTVNP